MTHPTVTLHNGVEMPALGFGTYKLRRNAEAAVGEAIAAGYRHIDTASMYGNEAAVGRAVRSSGLDRSELFVTTKIWNNDHGYERSRDALDRSRRELDLDPIDLVLIHWPGGSDRLDTWRQLEERLADGTVQAIGVSNYTDTDVKRLLEVANTVPMVNQVELNPIAYGRQRTVLQVCRNLGVHVAAWRPLMKGSRMDRPPIASIADRVGRTPAQVLLRWSIQHGIVPLPKSGNADRIQSNARVFDFELSDRDMAGLDAMGSR